MKKPDTSFRDIPPCIICWTFYVVGRIGYWLVGLFARKTAKIPEELQSKDLK
jgi:hypothetical protein